METTFNLKEFNDSGFPKLRISPPEEGFESVTVTFFAADRATLTGLIYRPLVRSHSADGYLEPEAAVTWGECIKVAGMIANRTMPPNFIARRDKEVILGIWEKADAKKKEVEEKNRGGKS